MFFSPFSSAITSHEEERAGMCPFCAFVCFGRVGLYLFPLPLGVRDWLRRHCGTPLIFLLFFYYRNEVDSINLFNVDDHTYVLRVKSKITQVTGKLRYDE